jgi:hypothetical protein
MKSRIKVKMFGQKRKQPRRIKPTGIFSKPPLSEILGQSDQKIRTRMFWIDSFIDKTNPFYSKSFSKAHQPRVLVL